MTRRDVFLLAMQARAAVADDFRAKALAHERHWGVFIRRLCGCPDTGETTQETCREQSAYIDRKEYEAARRTAMDLFDLKEKKHE